MNKAKLTINGKEETAFVGMYVLAEVCEKYGLDDVGVLGNNIMQFGFKWIPVVMWEGVKYSYTRQGEECDLRLHHFIDLLEDKGMEDKEIANYLKVFGESITKHMPKGESDEVKKKKQ